MSVLEGIRLIADTEFPLSAVREFRFEGNPGFVTAYELRFGSLVVSLVAQSDDDTLDIVRGSPPEGPQALSIDVSAKEPWCQAIGNTSFWGWQFTNTQGYIDGARFDFGAITIEAVVYGSAIKLSTSRRVPDGAA